MRPGQTPGDDPSVPLPRITEATPMLNLTVHPARPVATPSGGSTPWEPSSAQSSPSSCAPPRSRSSGAW